MKAPFLATEKTAATAGGSTRTCDSRKSLVRLRAVAGATLARRRGRTKKVSESPHTTKKLM